MILSLVLISCTSKIDYDIRTVSVKEFKEFINETGYITSAEEYGWSFVQENVYDYKVVNGANWIKPDGINIDYDIDPLWAKEKLKNVVLQGGLNPKTLFKSDDEIFTAATKYIDAFKDIPYVFNLGHGLLPQTDPVKVDKLIKFYRNFNG